MIGQTVPRFHLSYEVVSNDQQQLCVSLKMLLQDSVRLGSGNLVMTFPARVLHHPSYSQNPFPANLYQSHFFQSADSLASINFNLLTTGHGKTFVDGKGGNNLGQICFEKSAQSGPEMVDIYLQTTAATVLYLDDETTRLLPGQLRISCANEGQPCDDHDPNTENDHWDSNCQCAGVQLLCEADQQLNDVILPTRTYRSEAHIRSAGTVRATGHVDFRAGQSITLEAGFHAQTGSLFSARIEACDDNLIETSGADETTETATVGVLAPTVNPLPDAADGLFGTHFFDNMTQLNCVQSVDSRRVLDRTSLVDLSLNIAPNPSRGLTHITYYTPAAGRVQLRLFDATGREVALLASAYRSAGLHLLDWSVGLYPPGLYFLSLRAGQSVVTKRIMVQ